MSTKNKSPEQNTTAVKRAVEDVGGYSPAARICDRSERSVRRWCAGEVNISPVPAMRLAKAAGVDVYELLPGAK